jgi:glycosyltransferase involved in cell wall biosynthesis
VVSFDLICALSEHFEVSVLCRILDRHEAAEAQELEQYCHRVYTVFPPNRRSLLHRVIYRVGYGLRSLLGRRSMKAQYDCPGALVRRARELAGEGFDLVVLEYWQLYPLLDVFPPGRTLLLTHDIDMLVNRQVALLEKSLFRKIAAVRRWMLEQREEVRAYRQATRILALTQRDADEASRLSKGGARVDVLPFGVDVPAQIPDPDTRQRDEVLFMGAMGAAFNRDALVFFAREVYPHLDDGSVRVTIVGGNLPSEVSWFDQYANVQVVGRVDDVRPYLEKAACLVVPMRFGGGLRIRILEAMAAGIPIVCTSVAIAGMDFEAGRDFLLADDPAEIAAGISAVLEDPGLGASLARSAHATLGPVYGRALQRDRLQALFQDIVNT